jgi:tetratricopeptide (TPR) repeat protein
LGWIYGECGDLERALEFNRQSREVSLRGDDPEPLANAELNLGDVFLVRGEPAQAFEFYDSTYRITGDPKTSDWMKWRYTTHCFVSLGQYWLVRGNLAKAEDFANRCLEKATNTTSRKYLVMGWRLKGEVAVARQRWDDARTALDQALAIASQIGNPTQLWKTQLALGHLLKENGHVDQARQAYSAARDVIEQVKVNTKRAELRAGLENFPLFREVRDLAGDA